MQFCIVKVVLSGKWFHFKLFLHDKWTNKAGISSRAAGGGSTWYRANLLPWMISRGGGFAV